MFFIYKLKHSFIRMYHFDFMKNSKYKICIFCLWDRLSFNDVIKVYQCYWGYFIQGYNTPVIEQQSQDHGGSGEGRRRPRRRGLQREIYHDT